MKRKHKKKPALFREIAQERIIQLFEQAELVFHEDKRLSDRYVEIARKISMKYKVKIPKELKKRFCKHCHSYLVPGNNLRIRLTEKKIVYYCLYCKRHMRFPIY